ncbi:MAG: metallophosphoesterase, partial [Bacteroidales bacterium]|nr:metallophosphoesterase [Bacteroidales bacterium]
MKRIALLVSILALGFNLFAQNQEIFESGVETVKKPWTDLNFYNDPDNFQFAIVTDRNGGNRPGIFTDAVNKINLLYPEFVLSVGDLINGYTRDTAQIRYEWNEVNQVIDELKMPFFYLPGNHDITNQVMAKEWEKRYGERYYYFLYKNTMFIILDSNDDDDHSMTREQTDFAIETINQHPEVRWTFVLMHHPIWTYDTEGRFEEIEEALEGRKYSVLAGHTHHYTHENRKGQNYYVLATTGGGSSLRGNYFGEFDHITWVTMTDAGPSLANLRIDGILPHDIANKETQFLAGTLANNAVFKHVLLCNEGEKFTDGTLYLYFENGGEEPINIHLQFYHQHQLIIPEPVSKITLEAKGKQVLEIPFSSPVPIAYNEAEAIQI